MHLISYILVSALFWMGSMSHMCYQCTQTVTSEPVPAASCAEGKFDKNHLPPGVTVQNCGGLGCAKSIIDVKLIGYKTVTRTCASPGYPDSKCYDVPTLSDSLPQLRDKTTELPKQQMCICQQDYCNGAAQLDSRVTVAGMLAVIAMIAMY